MIFVYIFSGLIQSAEAKRRQQEIQEALNAQTGKVTVPAPDYLGKDLSEIEFDTIQYDYVIVSYYDPGKREGLIVGQDPQPGTGLNEDDRVITLYVNRNKPQTVILPEGIFLQRKELSGVFDYMIYLDVPEAERLERVLKRDTYIGNEQEIRQKYANRYFPAERHYTAEYRPEQTADTVIAD